MDLALKTYKGWYAIKHKQINTLTPIDINDLLASSSSVIVFLNRLLELICWHVFK